MSVGLIVELSALLIALLVGITAVYVIFEMRTVYLDHSDRFVRVVTAVETFQKAVLQSGERYSAAVDQLRDHLERRETKLGDIIRDFANDVRTLQEIRLQPEHSRGNDEYVRLSRDILANDPQLRFTLLKDWVSLNSMAITRRAGRPWTTAKQLITGVPDSFEAEAEVLDDKGVLLVNTRGYAEKVTIPIKGLVKSSSRVTG